MNAFERWTVLKPYVSRKSPGYFLFGRAIPVLLLFSILSGCIRQKTAPSREMKITKVVPAIFLPASDPGLSHHQDTVYYKEKFFSGYCYLLYDNGDTASLQSFFNGVEEGWQKKWYLGKQLMEERFYINGKKEGMHRGWWPDGKPKYQFTASNNEYNGAFREWYSSGLLGKFFHYTMGQEQGSQQLWWDNGTIRANYVIRNGRKYGLIGLKTCVNPYDSVFKK